MKFSQKRKPAENDDFLWLISLSDLMILLFIFFVVLFSFSFSKLKTSDFMKIIATFQKQPPPKDPVEKVHEEIKAWRDKLEFKDQVKIEKKDDELIVEFVDKVLFTSGASVPHKSGSSLIGQLTKFIEKVPPPYRIGIEGHTDDSPIYKAGTKDNWELASQRAWSVLHDLGLSPKSLQRTILMSYGSMNPVVPNRDENGNAIPKNQAINRRVTIRIF